MGTQEGTRTHSTLPRSVRQKQIVDIAEDDPDASCADIASRIPSATSDLVENVLDEYGDPADDEPPDEPDAPPLRLEHLPDPDELPKKQLRTLRAIYENPGLTQSEIGELLDISNVTVCDRVNKIDGFEWETRERFVRAVFGQRDTPSPPETPSAASNGSTPHPDVERLAERVGELEGRLAGEECTETLCGNPGLTHKVVHACMNSERITEDEELRIIRELVP